MTATKTVPSGVEMSSCAAESWQGAPVRACDVPMADAEAIRQPCSDIVQTSAHPVGGRSETVCPTWEADTPLREEESHAKSSRNFSPLSFSGGRAADS